MKKQKDLKKIIILAVFRLAASAALGALAWILDRRGVTVIMLSKGNSLMRLVSLTLFSLAVYYLITLVTAARINQRKGTNVDVVMLKGFYKVLCGISILIGVCTAFGVLGKVGGVFSQYGSMMLGWSLQAPVSGVAAWVMILITRPYKIGDRISFPQYGLMGDVIKFNPLYLTLNQVGGTVGSEDPSGRMLNVPNALLFSAMVINCSYTQTREDSSYVLDEILFRITLDSDWDTVENILLATAREVTSDIVESTGQEPFIRADTWDYGTLFRLQYMAASTNRSHTKYEIAKIATKKIQADRNVDLAIPYVYSFKRGVESADASGKAAGSPAFESIEISEIDCELAYSPAYYEENKEEILGLAESIVRDGLLQPVIVSRNADNSGRYTLLFGEKRLKACIILGWTKIPAEVKNKYGIDIKAMNKTMKTGDANPAIPVEELAMQA
ncbi:MAG: mechanosensitive ion channel [Oscillospiraceae bacterium]|nr:mechanosensitive ion channel [Oscillospiraceae bacterium]MCL1952664.1 mechanosensitive ion channel [Oscillospiraceae bacterium]